MKTLLRHTRTGLYFQGAGNWTSDPQNGYDFRFIDRAVHYVETWEMKEVELAFAFEDPQGIKTVSLAKTELRYAAG
jgi:hypothetical protein